MRTLIDIPDEQISSLSILAKAQKTSRAELVRRAIAAYIEQVKPGTVEAFGLWRANQEDGLAYQERQRSEW